MRRKTRRPVRHPRPGPQRIPAFVTGSTVELASALSHFATDKPHTSELRQHSGRDRLLRAILVRPFEFPASRRHRLFPHRRFSAGRAIARQTLHVRPHATLGYDSPPIAVSTYNHTKCAVDKRGNISWTPSSLRVRPRRALHGLGTPSYVYKGPSISDSDTEHPPCHLRVNLQPRRPVPTRRFSTRRYLPAFCAGVFSNAHTPRRAFLRP